MNRSLIATYFFLGFSILFTFSCSEPSIQRINEVVTPKEEVKTYTITIADEIGGSVLCIPQKEFYEENEKVIISAKPDENYAFEKWGGSINSKEITYLICISENHIIIPTFSQLPEKPKEVQPEVLTYMLFLGNDPGGSIQNSKGTKTEYEENEKVILIAVPNVGYTFSGWIGDVCSENEKLFITMSSNIQLWAQFEKIPEEKTYQLVVEKNLTGDIICNPAKSFYYDGEIVRLTAIPSAEYIFNQWNDGQTVNEIEIVMDNDKTYSAIFTKRALTVLVYMAADNDLESAAILDINEMECASINREPITILALIDRAEGYDGTNGNWTDTRLYEIKEDPNGINGTIVSTRIDCPELGLSLSESSELNMADENVLKNALKFCQRKYPALEYGVIFWGHGTGWRNSSLVLNTQYCDDITISNIDKAIAIDEYSNSFMPINRASWALNGLASEISFVGMDTCYGALLENVYEFKDVCEYFVGSENIVPSNGWDYIDVFNRCISKGISSVNFVNSIIEAYEYQYSTINNTSICAVKVNNFLALRECFDSFCTTIAKIVKTNKTESVVKDILLNDVKSFYITQYPTDMFLDLYSMINVLNNNSLLYTSNSNDVKKISVQCETLKKLLNEVIINSWGKNPFDIEQKAFMGIYFTTLIGNGVPKINYPVGYIKGSGALYQNRFVQDSTGWVPNKTPSEDSLLDVLFY